MEDFINAIEDAIRQENWLAALSLSLLMPDICGRIDEPSNKNSGDRYAKWFDAWFKIEKTNHTLAGEDCYALRCAITHEGRANTSDQKAKVAIETYHFVKPPTDDSDPHITEIMNILYIPVDLFAKAMCEAIKQWLPTKANQTEAQKNLRELIRIHEPAATVAAGAMTYPSFGVSGTMEVG
ncbi:hypothetical protein AGRHK599_LOCUS1188 [Rhizobium rhizogenes]|uniref:Uncharacterized protein n=1 Tax=Rhizobium rhizogenes TaxID=359 RepID=A0AAN2DCJ2_RHIRH|nr:MULTISPECIES: hypothetical protein [Rhizobium/Agrobacterium group]AQS61808.1 hypothetical protein B0909_05745 [Rhizobium rhizogenes]MCZ7442962.1 hypothetical protein [Rhizobium rhizogenes]NSZ78951.1 hypothetical protein [Agrobacterium tumefaciens]OAM65745.1 hypothetical protein A8L48_22380 [Rhizobium rhizogenes]CAD0211163.1 hypothetical protein AGRHK599_LOCUS1188 [Rhizobium rhizogenes]